MNSETRNCQNCKKDFVIKSDDFAFYEKIKVPAPTWCPECRMVRRMLFRNERTWYRRKCDATGENILSVFAPDKPYKVYKQDYWRSDAWDPLEYGREYNFSRKFFEQFNDLLVAIPHPNLIQKNIVDSEYSNNALNIKDCYFVAGLDGAEDSAYLFGALLDTKNCLDLHQCNHSEYSYELVDCQKSSRLFFSQACDSCLDSWFLYDCRGCQSCFGCVGLRNKQYYIYNEPYSKEEYQKTIKEKIGSHASLLEAKKEFEELKLITPHKYAAILKSENVVGDDISNARNCYMGFSLREDVENVHYTFRSHVKTRDGMDAYIAWNGAELFYECLSVSAQRVLGSVYIWGGFDVQYSYNCFDCNNIFGCVGLKNKSYCALNKQYTKDEYEKLVTKIIESMRQNKEYGEFFPADISLFKYNETVAQEYYPITKEKAIERDYGWRDSEPKNYNITIDSKNLPDNIDEVKDDIVNEVVGCEHSGQCHEQCFTAFKIIPMELNFYRRFKIPLPRLCPSCRHGQRLSLKNPLRLWHRKCMKEGCVNEFETSYAPDRKETVYCEQCYQAEVV